MADQHCGQSLQKRTEKELVSLYRKTPIDALNLPTEDAPQEKKLLYMVVQTLPQKECELILLRYYQKLTVAEISKILHRSPATIYRGLEHAHRLLKKALERM